MSLSIYTYSNPYEINNEPFWDSIKNCAHFCVSQTMGNGLSAVYSELNDGQLATVEELVEALYPNWFDTKTYIEQYTILTNTLDTVTPNIEPDRWKKIKQSLRFNKSSLLDSIRLMAEMGLSLKNLKIKKITEEQLYLVAAYKAILNGENAKKFTLRRNFSDKEIDQAVKTALVAKDVRRGKEAKSVEKIDCNTVVIHGIHQFTPTILSMIEEVAKYRRVVLLFNYQQQYKEIYQTWLDVYSCFDLNIKSQFNNEFIPSTLLQASYKGNVLADQIGKLADGTLTEKSRVLNDISVIEFDNITEFSAYVAQIFEDASRKYHEDENKKGSALSYMREQFYSANNSVNDILKVYFPEQFGERHFLAYPIGHFFVAVTNMWDSENGGIKIENMNDIAECLYSGALYEKILGSLITTFNSTKNYFSRATVLEGDNESEGVIDLLKKLRKQISKLNKGKAEYAEQLNRLAYYNVDLESIDELIEALETLNKITKLFYEDFENGNNNFKHFYEKIKDFVETQILPTADAETEFQDILLRLLARLEEVEKIETTSTFDCLKDTMAYYLKQESQKGESANWIVRDFQQIDGDVLKSSTQEAGIIYHFACVSDADMNVKREDQFPWPLTIEFFEKAYEPLDWKYQVYVKSRKEYKHFKRYALVYGLEFNRCNFKLSYIKNDDDKQNELYYILKLLGVKTERNIHNTTSTKQNLDLTVNLGVNRSIFVDLDGFRRRICGYRFALESLIEGGTIYQDRFLQSKYMEIMLANIVRRKLEGQIATEAIMNEALDDATSRLSRYFRFLNESEMTDIKTNTKNAIIHQALKAGKIKQFPKLDDTDTDMMRKKEEFIYLHLENENQENVLLGKFNDLTVAEKKKFLPENLKEANYSKEANIWCQWCAVREKCLESYKSLIEI
ncbi:MAG: hypothetical protein ACXAHE_14495 [Roseburia sp. 1XD42-69]